MIYEATKRAQWVNTQLATHSNPSLTTFGNEPFGVGKFDGVSDVIDNQFEIRVRKVPLAVCHNLFHNIGGNNVIRFIVYPDTGEEISADDCAESNRLGLVFNRDLSLIDLIDCGPHGAWNGSSCTCDFKWQGEDCTETGSDCSGHGTWNIYQKKCFCQTGYYGLDCADESVTACDDNDDCDDGYFCKYTNGEVGCTGPKTQGTCEKIANYRGGSKRGYSWSSITLDWFSAKNFCTANDQEMISFDDLDCPYSLSQYGYGGYCCADNGNGINGACDEFSIGIRKLRAAGAPKDWNWTNTEKQSCLPYYVNLNDGRFTYGYAKGIYTVLHALCK